MSLPVVDLVGVGLNATDTLISLAQFPVRGSKVEFAPVPLMPGGQTASAVAACRTWGLTTRYVGKLGDDDAARLHRSEFARLGVDARLIEMKDAASPQSVIIVDDGGERTVLIRRDDRLQLKACDLEREWVVNARALLVDGIEAEAATRAAGWAHEAGVPVIADIDEEYDGGDELLSCVDYLIVSRDFPVRVTGERDLARSLQILHGKYKCRLTAATLGPDGVVAWDGERLLHRAAFRVPVVDTTGAGDIFHAGFIYGLMQGWELDRQLDFACAAAALNCTGQGARGCIGGVEEILRVMETAERYAVNCKTDEFAS
jgi:sugar/nucleoside kinase (ribokinase family)